MIFARRNFSIILLSTIIIFSILSPNGVRAAIINNVWSIKFLNQYFTTQDTSLDLNSPPTTHQHAGIFLAQQAIKAGNLDFAFDAILSVVDFSNPVVLNAYAHILYIREDYEGAITTWKRANNSLALERAAWDLYAKDQPAYVLLTYQNLYELNREKYSANLAYTLMAQREYDQALLLLDRSIQDYPDSLFQSTWFRYLGDIYSIQGNWQTAETAYLQALQKDPDNSKALRDLLLMYDNLIENFINNHQLDEAISICEAAIKVAPSDIDILLEAGQLYEQTNSVDKAAEVYQKILQLDPGNLEALQAMKRLSSSD